MYIGEFLSYISAKFELICRWGNFVFLAISALFPVENALYVSVLIASYSNITGHRLCRVRSAAKVFRIGFQTR